MKKIFAGSLADLTKHEFQVRSIANAWKSLIQFFGEKLFAVLDFFLAQITNTRISLIRLGKDILLIVWVFTKLSDMLGITKNATAILTDTQVQLTDEIKRLEETLSGAQLEAKTLEMEERRLAKSSKAVAAEIKKRSDLIEEQKRLIDDKHKVTLNALKEEESGQKALSATIKAAIQATLQELQRLQAEVQRAAAFTQSIQQMIEVGERGRSQAGLGAAGKMISDLKFAQEDFKRAQEEFVAGNADAARKLTRKAVQASIGVMGADLGDVKLGILEGVGVKNARAEAEKLTEAAAAFAGEMQTAAQDAIPAVSEGLETLERQLEAGEATLAGVVEGIKLAKIEADDLKKKLSEDTSSTHRTEYEFIGPPPPGAFVGPPAHSFKTGGPVQPVKARHGKHFPGLRRWRQDTYIRRGGGVYDTQGGCAGPRPQGGTCI